MILATATAANAADPVYHVENALCTIGFASGSDLLESALCALPGLDDLKDIGIPPDVISSEAFDAIPIGHIAYAPTQPGLPNLTPIQQPTTVGAQLRVPPPGYGCDIYAYNPYAFKRPKVSFSVYGDGWNNCTLGLNMTSQACLYKEHHILVVPVWRRTICSVEKLDRRATYRPVSVRHTCAGGTGKWRTVVFGSIFFNGHRSVGAIKSLKSVKIPGCN